MARKPLDQRPAIAQWLIRARGEMTQDALLEALRRETGSSPDMSTYRGWESGRLTPRPSSLAPVVSFWGRRGVPGPDEAAPAASGHPSLEERAVLAAERQADAAELQAALLARQVALLERIAAKVTESEADPAFGDRVEAWALEALARVQPQRPARAAQ